MPELKNGKLKLILKEVTKTGMPATHDVTYLLDRMTAVDAMALAQKMEDYASPFTAAAVVMRNISQLLALWPASFPLFPTDANSLFQAIKALRAIWYQRANPRLTDHISLGTANKFWSVFIQFMEYMSRNGTPLINYGALGTNPEWNPETLRKAAKTVADLERANEVRGQAKDADYNDALVVPLSIHLSDEAYLAKYERDLQDAMDAIYKAAVEDLDAFIQMEKTGQELLDETRPKYKKVLDRATPENPTQNRYGDLDHGLVSIFDPAHPDNFAYKLAMVDMEMGGLPKPIYRHVLDPDRSKPGKQVYKRVRIPDTPARWRHLGNGGRRYDELLGHLGVMSIEAMVACLAIIHIENPSINVSSLQRAELEDADGHSILLVNAGEGDAQRLIVDKPRAETQKSVILKGKSLEAMQCIIRWTAKCRLALKEANDPNANKLLLFMNRAHMVSVAGGSNILIGFTLGKKSATVSYLSFVERHPELSRWGSRINMAALRVSAGVLAWFKSNGDEEAARRAFGHATSATSLRNYIPRQIQEAMSIRMIRRFQNLLICAACAGENYLLQATDFQTMAELHEFLSQMLTGDGVAAGNDLLQAIRKAHGFGAPSAAPSSTLAAPVSLQNQNTIYLNLTADGLAMLRLYRDRLLAPDISARVLDTPDPQTGTKPRLWLELGNAFEQHDVSLMESYPEYCAVIQQANKRVEELRGKVHFPDLSAA